MALSASSLAAGDHETVFGLIAAELQRLLPARDDPRFLVELRKLPVGLRAMASTYELDVSLALDDLGWHFGNWHDHALARETLAGLKELEAFEFASIFQDAYEHAREFWSELGSDNWGDWYNDSLLSQRMAPLNERAWTLWQANANGLFTYWVQYARKYPSRLDAL